MIALLDFIEANTDPSDPAQVHARAWAARVRELRKRQSELYDSAMRMSDVGKLEDVVREHGAITAELASLCHRQQEVLSRIRPAPETRQ